MYRGTTCLYFYCLSCFQLSIVAADRFGYSIRVDFMAEYRFGTSTRGDESAVRATRMHSVAYTLTTRAVHPTYYRASRHVVPHGFYRLGMLSA